MGWWESGYLTGNSRYFYNNQTIEEGWYEQGQWTGNFKFDLKYKEWDLKHTYTIKDNDYLDP